jgi:TetR/AcrR family transcriptional repressor of nem operon
MTSSEVNQARRPPDRRESILEAAERMARRGGYHGFSFRDVAAAVGVKSASIHHHFPTKEDLARALASRYCARFIANLGEPGEAGAVARLVAGYRSAIRKDDQMCLCGMFGAEVDILPEAVRGEVRGFYRASIEWTARALRGAEAQARAETLVAGLAGALLIARSMGDAALYDRVAERLVRAVV